MGWRGMFDFDEIEEVVAAKGDLGPRSKDEPPAPKPQPTPPGMCRPDPPKPSPTVQDDDDDDPFGGMTRSDPPPTSAKVVDDDDDDDDPFGGMVRKETPSDKSGDSGKCVISVRYRHKSQRWTHEYELGSGATVLDLKKKITAKEPEQACLFRLLRNSVPLRDEDKLTKSEKLDFLYDVPREVTAQKSNDQDELEITITLAAVFGIRTSMKVPKGLTVKALKELMVKQDPTNATKLGSFELMQDGGGRLLNDDEEISWLSRHLTLCPCKGG